MIQQELYNKAMKLYESLTKPFEWDGEIIEWYDYPTKPYIIPYVLDPIKYITEKEDFDLDYGVSQDCVELNGERVWLIFGYGY